MLKILYIDIMKSITRRELESWEEEQRDFFLIDVREEWEHQAYNIGGVLIPMGNLMSQRALIPQDKEVVVYCEKGIRSTIAIQRLESVGYSNLINLKGGMSAWKRQDIE